jgi:signal transduction histidine kinase
MKVRGLRIHWLLIGASSMVLAVPLAAALSLRLYETYLVRQTERQLIAQSVVIGEAWRAAWLEAKGETVVPAFRPPNREGDAFIPIEPLASMSPGGVQAPQLTDLPLSLFAPSPERQAGAKIEPLLQRMQVFNLSAARVLDSQGCVVATSRGEEGRCMSALPEVKEALAGRYASVVRMRISDEPLPPVSDVRSRGATRIFTALPLFSEGKVVGVVRMSRTSLDALTSLWHARRGLLLTAGAGVVALLLTSFLFAALIARPVRRLGKHAEEVALGLNSQPPRLRWAPQEVQQLGDALSTMTQKLQSRAVYVAELAANVSHELKSPITAIRGAAELLLEQAENMHDDQRRRFVQNIDADAARMERLVARLLELARIENAATATESVAVEPFFLSLCERYGPAVSLDVVNPPATVNILRDHLLAATSNLIENALRHGRRQVVRVRIASHGRRLMVQVTDTGSGISEANQKRLFERFFTTERENGGTGLGLSIVKAVADMRAGDISYQTGPSGTCFTLIL